MKLRLVRRIGAVVCAGAAAVALQIQPAWADGGGEQLMPDPDAYCVNSAPFQTQVNEAGWKVQYLGLQGNPSQNNWGCRYAIAAVAPGVSEEADSFTLPPFNYTMSIDWTAMCQLQYDGSTAQWVGIPGPLASPGPYGAPWLCLGAPGAQYDQSETPTGPVGRTG